MLLPYVDTLTATARFSRSQPAEQPLEKKFEKVDSGLIFFIFSGTKKSSCWNKFSQSSDATDH